ncbi:MAG: hypothetical protein V4463_02490 [Pseudomonadota bacterium]
MATELFSLYGGFTGWRSQRGDGYGVTSNLDGISIFYYSDDLDTVERAFYCACRRTFLRRFLPFVAPPPRELHIIIRDN